MPRASRLHAAPAVSPSRPSCRRRHWPTDSRFLRGTLTHGLLEHLPALPRDPGRRRPRLSSPARARNCRATYARASSRRPWPCCAIRSLRRCSARRAAPRWRSLPRCRTRKAGAGAAADRQDRPPGAGRQYGLIVDYKTNRPPPKDAAQVAEAYTLQLAAYRLAVRAYIPARMSGLPFCGPTARESWRFPRPCSMPNSSGCGSSSRRALTPEGASLRSRHPEHSLAQSAITRGDRSNAWRDLFRVGC